MSLLELLRSDMNRIETGASWIRFLYLCLTFPGLRAVTLFRVAHAMRESGIRAIPALLVSYCHASTGAHLIAGARIGPGLLVPHPTGLVVGDRAVIGEGCTLMQNVTIGERYARGDRGYPALGDRVIMGAGSVAVGSIQIGSDCVIGANSVVLGDLPPGSTAVGAPARVIRGPRQSVAAEPCVVAL